MGWRIRVQVASRTISLVALSDLTSDHGWTLGFELGEYTGRL